MLEVACGTGSLLAPLNGFDRVGLDVSTQMLTVARKKLGAEVTLVQEGARGERGDQAQADEGWLIRCTGPLEPAGRRLARTSHGGRSAFLR